MEAPELTLTTDNVNKYQLKRKLGSIETTMAVIHNELHGTTQANMLTRLNSTIKLSDLMLASEHLFKNYEILRCVIHKIDSSLWFCEHNDFNDVSIRHIHQQNNNDLDKLWLNEINTPLDASLSLWRILLATDTNNRSNIIVSWHHSIIDGDGFKSFVSKLLDYLDIIISGNTISKIDEKISPAIDTYLRTRQSKGTIPVNYTPIHYKSLCPIEKRATKIVCEYLNAEQLSSLYTACKTIKVRPHSVLSAALAMAVYIEGIAESPIQIKTAVSLRIYKELRESLNIMGCFISVADTPVDISGDDITVIALAYEKQLSSYMRNNCFNKSAVDINALNTFTNNIKNGNSFIHGFAISNLGEIDIPTDYNNFIAEDFIPTVSRVGGNFAIALQINTFNEQMKFRFSYPQPLFDEQSVTKISSRFLNLIYKFSGEPSI